MLSTPPAILLDALESSAVSVDEWRAVEPRALELIHETKEGAPTSEVNVYTRKHIRFLEEQGTFLPGSIAVDAAGKYAIGVAPDGGVDGWTLLTTAFRQRAAAEELRAVALYRDARGRERGASEDVDAIHAVVELATGEPVQVFQLYRRNDTGQIVYGKPRIEQAPSIIFAGSH